jgi:hypothetical protein
VNAWPAPPSQSVEPPRYVPLGAPAESVIGDALVSFVADDDENVDETPALFVTTIWYA